MNNIMAVVCLLNAIMALFGDNEYAPIHAALGWVAASALWINK